MSHRTARGSFVRQLLVFASASTALLTVNTRVHASGLEMTSIGAQSIGRGGAFVARASDPTAMAHNVAGLAGVRGWQVTASGYVALWQHCFARSGRYDGVDRGVVTEGTVFANSSYTNGRTAYPEVCNEGGPGVVPQLLVSRSIGRWLTIGGGLLTPAGVSAQRFTDRVQTSNGLAPAPQRYQVLSTGILVVHPTIAAAVQPLPWLRIGAALQPSIARFTGTTIVNAFGTQSPAGDIQTAADAWGFFFAGNVGVQLSPLPWLTIGAHVHTNGGPVALRGRTTATSQFYASDPSRRTVSQFDTEVSLPLPTTVRVGARAASLRAGTVNSPADRDPMHDELFDVELDVSWENSSVLDAVRTRNSGELEFSPGARFPVTPAAALRRSWRDVVGVRVGGDYNVIRDVLAIRAGFAWEQGAQTGPRVWQRQVTESNPDAGIDTTAYDNINLSLGASVRWRWFTVDVAYQHSFVANNIVDNGRATIVSGLVAVDAAACAMMGPPGPGACSNNRGEYRAALDVFSLGVTARF